MTESIEWAAEKREVSLENQAEWPRFICRRTMSRISVDGNDGARSYA
jgi:hypothetical protein